MSQIRISAERSILLTMREPKSANLLLKIFIVITIIIIIIIIITRPLPAYGQHGLAGSSGGDQSGRINSSHSMIHEFARFARSDWMRLSGGDQSERINSSHSIIDNFSTCQNNFSTCQNNFSTCQKNFPPAKIIVPH